MNELDMMTIRVLGNARSEAESVESVNVKLLPESSLGQSRRGASGGAKPRFTAGIRVGDMSK